MTDPNARETVSELPRSSENTPTTPPTRLREAISRVGDERARIQEAYDKLVTSRPDIDFTPESRALAVLTRESKDTDKDAQDALGEHTESQSNADPAIPEVNQEGKETEEKPPFELYLDSLEMPHEDDKALLISFHHKIKEAVAEKRHADYRKLAEDPAYVAALKRAENAQIKHLLPGVKEVMKRILDQMPELEIIPVEETRSDAFCRQRVEHLKQILDLDLKGTPAGDGSLGKYGEELMLDMVATFTNNGGVTQALTTLLEEHEESEDATFDSIKRNEIFAKQAIDATDKVRKILKNRAHSNINSWDVFGRQVDPLFYMRAEREQLFHAKPTNDSITSR